MAAAISVEEALELITEVTAQREAIHRLLIPRQQVAIFPEDIVGIGLIAVGCQPRRRS